MSTLDALKASLQHLAAALHRLDPSAGLAQPSTAGDVDPLLHQALLRVQAVSPFLHHSDLANAALQGLVRIFAPLLNASLSLQSSYGYSIRKHAYPNFIRDLVPYFTLALRCPHRFIEHSWSLLSACLSHFADSDLESRFDESALYVDIMSSLAPVYSQSLKLALELDAQFENAINSLQNTLYDHRIRDNNVSLPLNFLKNPIPQDYVHDLFNAKYYLNPDMDDSDSDSDSDNSNQSNDVYMNNPLIMVLPPCLQDSNITNKLGKEISLVIDTDENILIRNQLYYIYQTYAQYIRSYNGKLIVETNMDEDEVKYDINELKSQFYLSILYRCAFVLWNSSSSWDILLSNLLPNKLPVNNIKNILFNYSIPNCKINFNELKSLDTNVLYNSSIGLYKYVLEFKFLENNHIDLNNLDKLFHNILLDFYFGRANENEYYNFEAIENISDIISFEDELFSIFYNISHPLYQFMKEAFLLLLEYYNNSLILLFNCKRKYSFNKNISYKIIIQHLTKFILGRVKMILKSEQSSNIDFKSQMFILDKLFVPNTILSSEFVRHIFEEVFKIDNNFKLYPNLWLLQCKYEKEFGDTKKINQILRKANNFVIYNQQELHNYMILYDILPKSLNNQNNNINSTNYVDDTFINDSIIINYYQNQNLIINKKNYNLININEQIYSSDNNSTQNSTQNNKRPRIEDENNMEKDEKNIIKDIPIDSSIPTEEEEEEFILLPSVMGGHCIVIKNISSQMKFEVIYNEFSKYGYILDFNYKPNENTGEIELLIEFDSVQSITSILSERRNHPNTSFVFDNIRLKIIRCKPENSVWNFASKKEDCKLFINNLPIPSINFNKTHLRNLFNPFGKLNDIRLIVKNSNKSKSKSKSKSKFKNIKCFAYIEFDNLESAKSALSLNGSKPEWSINGPLSIVISDPENNKKDTHTIEKKNLEVYISNLPFHLIELDIKTLLGEELTKNISNIRLMKIRQKDKQGNYQMISKGNCFIDFMNEESMNKCIELFNNKEIEGRKLNVQIPEPKINKNDQRKLKRQLRAQKKLDIINKNNDKTLKNENENENENENKMVIDDNQHLQINNNDNDNDFNISKSTLAFVPRSASLNKKGYKF